MPVSVDAIQLQITQDTSKATKGIDALIAKLNELSRVIQGMGGFARMTQQLSAFSAVSEKIGRTGIRRTANVIEPLTQDMRANARDFAMQTTARDALESRRESVVDQIANELNKEGFNQAKVNSLSMQYQKMTQQLQKMAEQAEAAAQPMQDIAQTAGETAGDGFGEAFKQAGESASEMADTAKNSFGHLLKTLFKLRTLKKLVNFGKQGMQNLYQYSKGAGGEFASAMDSMQSSMLTLKNSIGTAIAPAIQAVIPIIQTLAGWIRSAANALSQLFAMLSGQSSWTKATDAVTQYGDAISGAGGGANDALAAFDELNVLSQGGGGGGGGGATDYSEMFTEVYAFDEKIKGIFEYIEKHLDTIKNVVTAVGVGILAWKLTGSVGISLAVSGFVLTLEQAYDIGYRTATGQDVGWQQWLSAGLGVATTALGAGMIGFKFGGLTGAAVGAALGIVVGVGAALIQLQQGMTQGYIDSQYGNIHLDENGVMNLVDSLFPVDAKAVIQNVTVTLGNVGKARSNVEKALTGVVGQIRLIQVGVTANTQNVSATVTQLVTAMQTYVDEQKKVITLNASMFTFTDSAGNDITSQLVADTSASWEEVSNWFIDIGKRIDEAIASGIELNGNSMVQALMSQMAEMTTAITQAQEMAKQMSEFELATLDKQSIDAVNKEFNDRTQAYRKAMQDTLVEQRAGYAGLEAFYRKKAADETISENERIAAQQQADYYKNLYESMDIPAMVNQKVAEFTAFGQEALAQAYKQALRNAVDNIAMKQGFYSSEFLAFWADWLKSTGFSNDDFFDALTPTQMAAYMKEIDNKGYNAPIKQTKRLSNGAGIETFIMDAMSSGMPMDTNGMATLNAFLQEVPHPTRKDFQDYYGIFADAGWEQYQRVISEDLQSDMQSVLDIMNEIISTQDALDYSDARFDWFRNKYENANELIQRIGNELFDSGITEVPAGFETLNKALNLPAGGIMTAGMRVVSDVNFGSSGYKIPAQTGGVTAGLAGQADVTSAISTVDSTIATYSVEQNNLLRQQNAILTKILAKNLSVNITPSSSLGRVVTQSAGMYANAGGKV